MTHEYTVLVGGVIVRGEGEPEASAIAWAADTILAIGTDAEVLAISRGDSHVHDLADAFVVPLAPGGTDSWPTVARLEIGGRADLAVLDGDPRRAPVQELALVRGGRVVAGALPGAAGHAD